MHIHSCVHVCFEIWDLICSLSYTATTQYSHTSWSEYVGIYLYCCCLVLGFFFLPKQLLCSLHQTRPHNYFYEKSEYHAAIKCYQISFNMVLGLNLCFHLHNPNQPFSTSGPWPSSRPQSIIQCTMDAVGGYNRMVGLFCC